MDVVVTNTNISTSQVRTALQRLVDYACAHQLIEPADRLWAYNQLLDQLGATAPGPDPAWQYPYDPAAHSADKSIDFEALLATLTEVAVATGRVEDSSSGRDRAAMGLMGVFVPRPSQIRSTFEQLFLAEGAKAATDWFYQLCEDAGYVRRSAIAKNIAWTTPTRWGDLEITINLSKPEKDPRDIAAAGAAKATNEVYPACQLCLTNEGYAGRAAAADGGAHPARQNLRLVGLELGGEPWGLQYSPYAYFEEHCIAISPVHRLMHVDAQNLGRLLDFVDQLPHYFVGSNADLPIVGGSILSHDHFQGGAHTFPMMRSTAVQTFELAAYPHVSFEVLNWPMSVLRLSSTGREELLAAASRVLDVWRDYSDESVSIKASEPDGTRHNTITPVCQKQGDTYVLYLALRCNITSEEHPLGVFHPHAELHHIKKENIGLIEVMGLAILPPRLVGELKAVEQHLLDAQGSSDTQALRSALEDDPATSSHAEWALNIAATHPELNAQNAQDIIRDEVGQVFGNVLEDAGVFKWDDTGRDALQRFIARL